VKRFEIVILDPSFKLEDGKISIDWFIYKERKKNLTLFSDLYSEDQRNRLLSEPRRYKFSFKLSVFGYGFIITLKLHSTGEMIGYEYDLFEGLNRREK